MIVSDPLNANNFPADTSIISDQINPFTLSNIVFYGCIIINIFYYERLLLLTQVKDEKEVNPANKEQEIRNLKDWIRSEMISHHILCTILSLLTWNVPLLIANVVLDVLKLWWWFIVRFDADENVFTYLKDQFMIYTIYMGLCVLYLIFLVLPKH